MGICSLQHVLYSFVRLISKRSIYLRGIFILCLILTVSLFILIKIKSFHPSLNDNFHLSSSNNVLDECMLDNTPCYPDIEQSLDRYFSKFKNRFSMLLKYHPRIDCEHGRYLLLNDRLSSHVYHGTGSQLMWYLGVLNVAYVLNLTLIHLEWSSEHSDDENNFDRDKYWKFFDWEIPFSAYQSCPLNSSVRRNIFKYDLIPEQTFDQHHKGKQVFTIKKSFKSLFNRFVNNLHDRNTGFTFYSSRTFTITSSLMEVGVVFEIRWWLQHRKLYNQHTGVWAGFPMLSNSQPIDCPSININDVLLIGVHIRHGDVVQRNNQSQVIAKDFYRYIANSAYSPVLISIINSLPIEIQDKYLITIYSEGVINDFNDILTDLKKSLPQSPCHLSFVLNGRTSETFNRLLRDDVIIGALSTFSLATGIFNSRQLKIGRYHNGARVHGMRNHFKLDLNSNHTHFRMTEEKLKLIKQRIEYVWKQKQAQQKTYIPLWLDNYSSDYPEEFMLI
jgi:hypothetical protein